MKKVGVRESQDRMLLILLEIDRICKKNNITYWLDQGTLIGAARHKGFIPWDDDLDIGMYRVDYNRFLEVAVKELSEDFVLQTPLTDEDAELAYAKVRDLNSEIDSKNNKGKYRGIFVDVFAYDDETSKNVKLQKSATRTARMKWFGELDFKKPFIKNIAKNLVIVGCKLYKLTYVFIPFKNRILKIYNNGLNADVVKDGNKMIYGIEAPFVANINKSDVFPVKEIEFEGHKFPVPKNHELILEYFYGEWTTQPKEADRVPSHSDCIYIK